MFGASATPGKQMFDENIAQSAQMSYSDDDTKKTHWVKTLRNYLIGRCWEMRQLLVWAESFQKRTITFLDIQTLAHVQSYMEDIGFDPMRASSELWSFLNLNVTGNGRNKFDAAQELNGFAVWRRIVVPVAPRTVARRVEMYTSIHSPGRCKHFGEMTDHLDAWERKIDEFVVMGSAIGRPRDVHYCAQHVSSRYDRFPCTSARRPPGLRHVEDADRQTGHVLERPQPIS